MILHCFVVKPRYSWDVRIERPLRSGGLGHLLTAAITSAASSEVKKCHEGEKNQSDPRVYYIECFPLCFVCYCCYFTTRNGFRMFPLVFKFLLDGWPFETEKPPLLLGDVFRIERASMPVRPELGYFEVGSRS